ncbi:MAG: hypothetical protein AB7K52_03185 [Phycisphaerales bacterium]
MQREQLSNTPGLSYSRVEPKPAPVQRWENEGGHAYTSPRDVRIEESQVQAPPGTVEDREDLVMREVSPEGMPPPHAMRRRAWRMFALIFGIAGVLGVGLAVVFVPIDTLLAIPALLLVLIVAASPVLGAAFMRGREHARARRIAEQEVVTVEPGDAGRA